jgi:hypothetical protein
MVVNDAPAAMPFNATDVSFVSSRVGNFQHSPHWQVLLDQLWAQ